MHFHKLLAAAVITSVLSGCVTSNSSSPGPVIQQSYDDNLIVPGQRVGKVYLGMPLSQLYKEMGTPDMAAGKQSYSLYDYKAKGMRIWVDANGVTTISAWSTSLHTAEGLHVGSSDIEVRSKLGFPSDVASIPNVQTTLIYHAKNPSSTSVGDWDVVENARGIVTSFLVK